MLRACTVMIRAGCPGSVGYNYLTTTTNLLVLRPRSNSGWLKLGCLRLRAPVRVVCFTTTCGMAVHLRKCSRGWQRFCLFFISHVVVHSDSLNNDGPLQGH